MSSRGTPPPQHHSLALIVSNLRNFSITILQFNHSGSAHPPKFRAGPIRIMMQRTMGCTRLCRGVLDCAGKPKIHRPLSFKPSTVDYLHDLDGLGWSAETEYQACRTCGCNKYTAHKKHPKQKHHSNSLDKDRCS